MTLKERFKSLNTSFGADVKYYHHNINKCEKIADEFAIGFAEWLLRYNKEWPTVKELLEIYKQEKGL
jgi:hypothetical protein